MSIELQPALSKPRRRWFQYSLRSLMIVVTLAAIGMSWFAARMQRAKRQREAVREVQDLGGRVSYEEGRNGEPKGPASLRSWLGEDFFAGVVAASVPSDEALEKLEALPSLQELAIEGCKSFPPGTRITDAGLTHLQSLPELRKILFCSTCVSDDGLRNLSNLNRLEDLSLGSQNVTGVGLTHLGSLPRLRELDLYGSPITDNGLKGIEGLTQIRVLRLHFSKITDAGLVHLKSLTGLQELDLSVTQVTDTGLENLNGLKELRELRLCGTKVTVTGVAKLHDALPHCEIDW